MKKLLHTISLSALVAANGYANNNAINIKTGYLNTNDGRVWYETANLEFARKHEEQCELYVHGNSAPASTWMKAITTLRQNLGKCTISFDLLGHGKSGASSSGYGINTDTKTLSSIISNFKLDKLKGGYSTIAWSYGGEISTEAHAGGKLPNLNRLVYIGNPPLNFSGDITKKQTRQDTFAADPIISGHYLFKDLDRSQTIDLSKAFYCHNNAVNNKCAVPKELTDSVLKTRPGVRPAIWESNEKGEFTDAVLHLKMTKTPVCNFYGKYDALISEGYMNAVYNITKPDYQAVAPTGHAVATENPKWLSQQLDHCFTLTQ